jgi:hypothetical protein
MVAGLAFVATAVGTLFAEATFKRWRQGRRPHEGAWRSSCSAGLRGRRCDSPERPGVGQVRHDEAFTVSLAAGIAVIYAGFLVAARPSNVSDHRGVSGMTTVGAQPV